MQTNYPDPNNTFIPSFELHPELVLKFRKCRHCNKLIQFTDDDKLCPICSNPWPIFPINRYIQVKPLT